MGPGRKFRPFFSAAVSIGKARNPMTDGENLETIPDRGRLSSAYEKRKSGYARLLSELEARLRSALELDSLTPLIKGRIKSFDSWYA
jgi:hypothetical protein